MTEVTDGFSMEKLDLTPTEKRLLELLRSRPRHIYSRKELLAQILPNAFVLERTVDVHVRAVRKKLGEANRIRTIRGMGYVWD